MLEIWKDIPDFEGYYQASNFGRIKSLTRKGRLTEKILHKKLRARYFAVSLSKNGIWKSYKISKLVALTFLPNPYNYRFVLHRNDIKTDDRLENLRWGTPKQNNADAVKNGRYKNHPKGERHYKTKLNNKDIIEIRKMWETNNFYKTDIAKKFNICRTTVYSIVNNKTWKHV